jgi:hypothetical protein
MLGRCAAAVVLALLVLAVPPAHGRAKTWNDVRDGVLQIARQHQRALETSVPRRERDVREAEASLDRISRLYARGLVTRPELDAAARDVGDARAQLSWTRNELRRTAMLIVEIEARQKIASLPPLRPGQYDASAALIRFHGIREVSRDELALLERHVTARGGNALPVSARGQSDVHTRLGLDHRHAVDLALHPDSVEGRLVPPPPRAPAGRSLGGRTRPPQPPPPRRPGGAGPLRDCRDGAGLLGPHLHHGMT